MSETVEVRCQSPTCKALQPDPKAVNCFSCKAPLSCWSYVIWLQTGKPTSSKENEVNKGA